MPASKISDPTETCAVQLGDGQPVALSTSGRVEGLPRYEAQAPACPIQVDVVDGAVIVSAPAEACVFQEADCRVEPLGMWGPDPASLLPKAASIEEARGTADKAVRENYKALAHKDGPQSMRPVVAEQAAFSADRETLCRVLSPRGRARLLQRPLHRSGGPSCSRARLRASCRAPETTAAQPERPRPRPPRRRRSRRCRRRRAPGGLDGRTRPAHLPLSRLPGGPPQAASRTPASQPRIACLRVRPQW